MDVHALKVIWRRLLLDLSSLPRAIGLMTATFAFSALGTVIPQNKVREVTIPLCSVCSSTAHARTQGLDYYLENYPVDGASKVLGFLDANLLLFLDLDHVYTAWLVRSALC
jgi:cytochrome c biogenesis protein